MKGILSPRHLPVLGALLAVNVVNFIDRQLPAILAEQIKHDLQLSDTQLGLLTGLAFALVYSVAAIPLARLSDRWSPKNILLIAIVFWSGMTAIGAAARGFSVLAITRTGVALAEAATTPATHAVICKTFQPGLRGRAIGIASMGAPIGIMLGLAAGGWISDNLGWRTAFAYAAILGLAVAILAYFCIPRITVSSALPSQKTDGSAVVALLADRRFCWLIAAMCLYGLAAYPFLAFTASFAIRLHQFTAARAGLTLGLLLGVLGLLGTVAGGIIFDRSTRTGVGGSLRWPAIALVLSGPATAVAWFVPNDIVFVALLSPFALAITFYAPALFGVAHAIAGQGREATASSLLMVAAGLIGGSLGPLLVGLVSDALAPTLGTGSLRWALQLVPLFAVAGGCALLAADAKIVHDTMGLSSPMGVVRCNAPLISN